MRQPVTAAQSLVSGSCPPNPKPCEFNLDITLSITIDGQPALGASFINPPWGTGAPPTGGAITSPPTPPVPFNHTYGKFNSGKMSDKMKNSTGGAVAPIKVSCGTANTVTFNVQTVKPAVNLSA